MGVRSVRSLVIFVIAAAGAAPLAAQDTTARDTTRRTDTVPAVLSPFPPPLPAAPSPAPAAPAPPTLEQVRYLEGLRTTARGVAQLRDGVDRVIRTQQRRDTVAQRRAGQRLGGLCTSARSFIASGRPKLQASAYEDSMRVVAKRLVVRIDTLAQFLPTCAQTARRQPAAVATDLTNRLRGYDDALVAFRAGIAAQNKPDSIKTVSQQ